jgi:hypothetical protein
MPPLHRAKGFGFEDTSAAEPATLAASLMRIPPADAPCGRAIMAPIGEACWWIVRDRRGGDATGPVIGRALFAVK